VYVERLNRPWSNEREFAISFVSYETIDGATNSVRFGGENLCEDLWPFRFARN
jgi:hypothetical protein